MSNITFPLRGDRLRVTHSFPSEEELNSLSPQQWLQAMATYENSTGNIGLVAPVDATVNLVQWELPGGEIVPVLEFIPRSVTFVYRVPVWSMPAPNRFYFYAEALADLNVQRNILRSLLESFAERFASERARLCEARFEGSVPTECVELSIPRTITDTEVNNWLLRPEWNLSVIRGQEIRPLDRTVHFGIAHALNSDHRFWFDAHELYKRIRHADEEDRVLQFPFRETPAGGSFKIWYENYDRLPLSGAVQVEKANGGLQETTIYQPPVEHAADRSRDNRDREYVPAALLLLMEGRPVDVSFSDPGVNFQLQLLTALSASSTVTTTDTRRPTVTEGEARFRLQQSSFGYSFPDHRTDPYLAVLTSGERSLSLYLQNDIMQRVQVRARDLIDKKLSLMEWLRHDERAAKVQIFNRIETFVQRRAELRSRLNTSRYDVFLTDYRTRLHQLDLAVTALTGAMNDAFFRVLQADPSEENFEILTLAVDALSNTERGDTFLEESFRGFLLPELRTSGRALIPFEFITGVWNTGMRFRSKVVDALLLIARIDLYLAIREMYSMRSSVDRVARLGQLVRRFEARFGEMHHLRITTGEFEVAGMRMQNFHFEWDTAALDGEDLPAQRHADRTRAGNAAAAATTLNTLNLLSSIFSIFSQGLEIYHRRESGINWQDVYTLTENTVGVADAVADLLPSRVRMAARPGWGAISGGVGLVFSAVSLSKVMQDAMRARAGGDYAMSSWLVVSAAGSAVSLGASGLVALGAASGPLSPVIIAGSLIALWAGIIAGSSASSRLELDLDHTFFGRHYDRITGELDARPADALDPLNFAGTVRHNQYYLWVRQLITQIGYLNNHIFPLNATLSANTGGASVNIYQLQTGYCSCVENSRVHFILLADSVPDRYTEGTFVLNAACFSGPVAKEAGPEEGTAFTYEANRNSSTGQIRITIRIALPRGLGFEDVDQAILSVTHQASAESLTNNSNELLRNMSRETRGRLQDRFGTRVVAGLRDHPYNLLGGAAIVNSTANKSTQFIRN